MTQHDQPDCFELIRTVNDFLESIEGKLHGSDKYGLQCAKHVLNIIARELIINEQNNTNNTDLLNETR